MHRTYPATAPAALYAILAVKAYSRPPGEPLAAILSRVNDDLCRLDDALPDVFVVNTTERPSSFQQRRPSAGDFAQRKKSPCSTAGKYQHPGRRAICFRFEIPRTGVRIFSTDCLVERANAEGEQFGETRLVDTLKKFFFEDLDALIDKTLETFFAFAGGAENKDDLTIAAMEIE